ncbi:HEAT repeat domain-containing protein [bacterium]|nr:HEAT repeat domain-containing protein [bacterium]
MRGRLDDPERSTRQLAAQILLRHWVDNKETAPLEQILRQAPADVRGRAILAIVHSEGLDPVPLAQPLRELCQHPDEELRSRAVQGVAWLGQQGYQSDSELKLLRGLLGHPEVETRQRALKGLESLVKQWGTQGDPIVAEVRQLLESDRATRYYSLGLLRKVAAQAAIESCFPLLVQLLLHDEEGYADDAGVILLQAIEAGHLQPFLVEAMAPGWGLKGEQERYLVSQCYQAMARAGLDLKPALAQMMAALTGPRSCYVESYFADDLTRYLTRSARLEPEAVSQLERLLEARADVSGCVAQALAARAKEGMDLTPLLPSLVKMLGDRHWFAGDGARQALLAQGRLMGPQAVLQAAAGASPSRATLQLRKELEGP